MLHTESDIMKKGVTLDVYRNIKKKFGDHASWAIWSELSSNRLSR